MGSFSIIRILKNQDLQAQESWLKLIELYQGNPQYLESISNLIKDIFDGKVSNFLQENNLFLTEVIKSNFTKVYRKLSPPEKQIVLELISHQQAQFKKDIEQNLSRLLSKSELVNSLQSLNRRYLIEKNRVGDEICFHISRIFRAHLANL